MQLFGRFALRRKLTLIIFLVSTIGLLLEGAAIIAYEMSSYRQQMVQDTATLAQIIGDQNSAMLFLTIPKRLRKT